MAKTSFKQEHDLEKRKAEASRIREKDRIPDEGAALKWEPAVLELGRSESHQQPDELLMNTRRMELEILELEKEIQLKEKYLEHLQTLHDVQTRKDLSNSFLAFYSDWDVDECEENGMITLSFKNCIPHSKICNDVKWKGQKTGHKLHLRVDQKTFSVDDIQLEPNDTPIDDIVQAMVLSRRMHSSGFTLEPYNDFEFLLRKVGQRISLMKKL